MEGRTTEVVTITHNGMASSSNSRMVKVTRGAEAHEADIIKIALGQIIGSKT